MKANNLITMVTIENVVTSHFTPAFIQLSAQFKFSFPCSNFLSNMFSSVSGFLESYELLLLPHLWLFSIFLPKKPSRLCSNYVLRKVFLWVFSINLIYMDSRLDPRAYGSE